MLLFPRTIAEKATAGDYQGGSVKSTDGFHRIRLVKRLQRGVVNRGGSKIARVAAFAPATRTLPFCKSVAVWLFLASMRGPTDENELVIGSKSSLISSLAFCPAVRNNWGGKAMLRCTPQACADLAFQGPAATASAAAHCFAAAESPIAKPELDMRAFSPRVHACASA